MIEPNAQPATHSENFSLRDFLPLPNQGFHEQVEAFSQTYRQLAEDGAALYMREILGPADATVTIRDRQTGATRDMLMLGSNNYLGFANHPAIKQAVKDCIDTYGVGCGGPPLLNGTTQLHRQLEARLAALKGAEDALIYSSGFLTNVGWVTALMRPQDILIYDEYSHASLFDALKLARCKSQFFAHNDMAQLAAILKATRERAPLANIVVSVEGVYSMDGDLAPLPEIRALCTAHGAWLNVDDAHGTGVMGHLGAGTANHLGLAHGAVDLAMGTFSKTFGTVGGFIAGSQALIDYLRFFSRTYMFSASLPHTVIATVVAGLDVMRDEPWRQVRLHENATYVAAGLRRIGLDIHYESAILPIIVPESVDLRTLARRLHEEGLFCNAIEAPAVPPDKQRLRLSIMATHTRAQLDQALAIIERVGKEVALIP
ncbi:MAG: 8-amino-7-oxononanoate synthase [Candidatus Sericytochromatia bacterium]|nr:8-amino-7-oxononanoate synthase [Candidatus Sericytochromatia bacterium]